MKRDTVVTRTTGETDITVSLHIDGKGTNSISTGNGFFDHMLTLFAAHGRFDLECTCKGDVDVDFHHSAEDIGICLGRAFAEALGDMKGITRYATAYVPMDSALARVCVDICKRANLVYAVTLREASVGDFECYLAGEFFKAVTDYGGITMHIDLIRGDNAHHSLEAVFKACGRGLREACAIQKGAENTLNTTKGTF
jgi:imidazoleglycerol-phosphate dehydratase